MVAYLQKSEGSEEFHQIIDFLNASHIQYARIENPTIYVYFIKQFWSTATARTSATGELEDNGGVTTLPNSEIFKQLALMGFIQICLNKQKRLLQPYTRTYYTPVLTQKVFSNMKRVTKGYFGEDTPLFASMITAFETSPSRITSSPSLSPQHTPFTTPSTSQPSNIHTTPVTKEAASMPHESPNLEAELAQTKQTYGTALTKLIKKVKKLEQTMKTSQSRRRTRVVLSDKEEVSEDPSKQGRKIQEKISDDTEVLLEEEETTELVEEPTKLVEDQGSGEKGEQEVTTIDTALNTASVPISTASATPEVSSAAVNLVYIRRSAKKRKDKGKVIMIEDEYVQKKSKKQLEQERLSHEEAIRLQEQIDEKERKRIARDAEIAKQLQEEYDKAGKKEAVAEVDTAHVIDWNDPSVIRYHALQNRPRSVAEVRKNMIMYLKNQGGYKMKYFKGMSYDDIRPIFEKIWDQVHSFVPMDSEKEVQRLKRAGQDVEAKPAKRQRTKEVSESVQEQTDEEPKTDELSQEQLNQMVIIVPDEGINVEALQTKYPIIGWEVYSEDTMQFLENHHIQERYNSSGLTKDKEIELWVELKMLFEPDAENLLELQKYMHDPLKWWLYDMCAVHHVFTEKGQDIFMLVKKDYPLTKGLATLMLCNKLRVDQQTNLSTARPKLSTDSTKIESMKLEAIVEERRIFNKELASPKQTALGKDISNSLIVDSLLKTIVEQEVKETASSSSSSKFSDYSFCSSLNQPNGSQLVYEDLEKFHKDDIEEMDLKWQLALLSIRTRRFFQKTGRKITINGSDTAGYDKSKVECFNYSEISMLKNELEKLKQEKESNQLKIENFDNASKRLFSPPKFDLSNSSLEEFQQPEFEGCEVSQFTISGGKMKGKLQIEDTSNEVRESLDAPLVKKLMSDDKLENKTIFPTVAKIEFVRPKQQEKPVRKPVKYAEMYRSQSPRGNQRNWNNQKSQQLGSNFMMYNKACFVCGSLNHVEAHCNYHQRERVESRNNYTRENYNYSAKNTHPSAYRNMVPWAVLIKTGLKAVNAARPVTTTHPKTIGHLQKEDQGYVDSGCSRHMTWNMSYLSNFKEFDGGYVTFGGGAKGGKITGKGTLKTADENQVLLKVPRKNNMSSVDIKNIVPKESLSCLVAKATLDESMIWHRRL
ncbi:hypothetical protein Tco_1417367, partial [Tanacetum coccineum]